MNQKLPTPPSHKTFTFGAVTLSSDFDSGNLFNAQQIQPSRYDLWIAVDHPKNQYRTWFYFSAEGIAEGTTTTFTIKNMQNQGRLLRQGLQPVCKQEGGEWERIAQKVDISGLEYCDGCLQWSFKHRFASNKKVYFAFFYPWSNDDNRKFLKQAEEACKQRNIYFKRSTIIKTIQGRPVDLVTITSKRGMGSKTDKFGDHLFLEGGEPREFSADKKAMVVSARVHPGEVPGSHVMTGLIKGIIQDSDKGRLLRDHYVFYIIPILNPDGVGRGHYRVDTNGINLNRCYLTPSHKYHPSIYAIRKLVLYLHSKNKYFGFLDLHAHAGRKGAFIYGNATNQLSKQLEICLFPKILGQNSEIFDYEGSNFTEKNMHVKEKNDHMSKDGAGRVAFFTATGNPRSWTLEINYNMSRVINVLTPPRPQDEAFTPTNEDNLNSQVVTTFRPPTTTVPKYFYTIQHYHQLGRDICEAFLDYAHINPTSRLDNGRNFYQSVEQLKLNLAVALLRMAPNRFEGFYRQILNYIDGTPNHKDRAVRALYFILSRNGKISDLSKFIAESDDSTLTLPKPPPPPPEKVIQTKRPEIKIRIKQQQVLAFSKGRTQLSKETSQNEEDLCSLKEGSNQQIPNYRQLNNNEESSESMEKINPNVLTSDFFKNQEGAELQFSDTASRKDTVGRRQKRFSSLNNRNIQRLQKNIAKPIDMGLESGSLLHSNIFTKGQLVLTYYQEGVKQQYQEMESKKARLRGVMNFNTLQQAGRQKVKSNLQGRKQ